jgi:hypothetical protein
MQIRQRQFDPITGTYGPNEGQSYSVERRMPVPYKLALKLDIWTSNTEQKLQIIEQISQLFNPSMELQSDDNYIDWASLTVVTMTDNVWDSRSVPTGGDEPISVATMNFEIPIWISTSVKVKKMGVIQRVITNFQDLDTMDSLGQTAISINNFSVLLSNSQGNYYLKLLSPVDANQVLELGLDTQVTQQSWSALIAEYGNYNAGSSEIRLSTPNDSEIIGTIAISPTDDSMVIFNPYNNTLPANTMNPINAIIDPQNVSVSSYLTSPAAGTRYLLINDIGSAANGSNGASAWQGTSGQNLIANANDIVQYTGTYWQVLFDSQTVNSLQYVTNLTTGIQYKWQDQQWTKSYDGVYNAGEWMIVL